MTRTFDEMYVAALAQRQKMLDEGRDPAGGKFVVTQHEKLAILDKPPFMNPALNVERDRICGLKVVLLDAPSQP